MALRREYGQAARVLYGILPFSGSPGRYNSHSPLASRSRLGTIGKNHIQSSSSFSQNCSFVCSESDTFLMNYTMTSPKPWYPSGGCARFAAVFVSLCSTRTGAGIMPALQSLYHTHPLPCDTLLKILSCCESPAAGYSRYPPAGLITQNTPPKLLWDGWCVCLRRMMVHFIHQLYSVSVQSVDFH